MRGLEGIRLPDLEEYRRRADAVKTQQFQDFLANNYNPMASHRAYMIDRAGRDFTDYQFINRFGKDKFNQLNDGTENSFNLRSKLLAEAEDMPIVAKWETDINNVFQRLSPFNLDGTRKKINTFGLSDDDWYKYNETYMKAFRQRE